MLLSENYKYPICPECHANTIVGFARPGDPESLELSCSNGETTCHYRQKFSALTTSKTEPTYRLGGLEKTLVSILSRYCGERGDNEGAIETLDRIVRERGILLRKHIDSIFK